MIRLAFFIFTIAVATYGCTRPVEPVASRAPWPGCKWERHEFKELGVRLLFQNCKDPSAHYELSTKDNWLQMHRSADDVTYGGPALLQVFTKPSDQNIQEAINDRFVKNMAIENKTDEPLARKSCQAFQLKLPNIGESKQIYTISPTGPYKEKIYKELKEGPRDFGCGTYGEGQTTTYFEFHPLETKTKYAFVVFGQDDEPLFDEKSIEFIDK